MLTHPASADLMRWVCYDRAVKPTAKALWDALEATGAARLAREWAGELAGER